MNNIVSDDWYDKLGKNVIKFFQLKEEEFNTLDVPKPWKDLANKFWHEHKNRQFTWEELLGDFKNHGERYQRDNETLEVNEINKEFCEKQAERLFFLNTSCSGIAITGNADQIEYTFKKSKSHKINLIWLLIIIAYLHKENGHKDDFENNFQEFALLFNGLIASLKPELINSNSPELRDLALNAQENTTDELTPKKISQLGEQVRQFPINTEKQSRTKKAYQSVPNHADMLILVLAEKYVTQLQGIAQKNKIEPNNIESVLKKYEWLWHGDGTKRPDSFLPDPDGNLCWFEMVFDKNKSKKPIISRLEFNDLMRLIKKDGTFIQSLKVGESFQMNGSGLKEKGFKKI